ncbi:ParA family protein [Adlercreutzia caecimuris]|uniref:nucleotide-binding protein n=1 Tax=Adlercreutzia caecimuris TaxID=671266 RepID=UPI001373351E|nr:ParA family protein [Adlercreutzia caecimuris]
MAGVRELPFALAPVTVVVGHYGVGKTNFALNLALDAAAAGYEVTLADMDVVNPYFRSSECASLLEEAGVRLIAPVFGGAGTSLDVPSLTGAVVPAVEAAYAEDAERALGGAPEAAATVARDAHLSVAGKAVVIDAGGDDVGATALARFASAVRAGRHEVLYVVNARRNLTQTPDEAASVLGEIEETCGLAATAVVNNTHLQGETTLGHITESVPFAQTVARKAGVPVACTTVPKSAIRRESDPAAALSKLPSSYPVEVLVAPPWA